MKSFSLSLLTLWFSLFAACAASGKKENVGREVVMYFEPWQSIASNVSMSQRYYDMPLHKAEDDMVSTLRAEALLAARYGVTAFGMTIATTADWAYASHFKTFLKALEGTELKVFPAFNSVTDSEKNLTRIRELVESHGQHPNWMRVNGKLVWSTFWAARRGGPEMYQKIRSTLEAEGIETFIIGDPDSEWGQGASLARFAKYKDCFDMVYSFGETGRNDIQSVEETFRVLAEAARETARAKAWMAPVSPGYLGGWISGRNEFYIPFRNLDQYLEACEAVLRTNPDWIHFTTWNDKDETHLQPSLYQWETLLEIGAYTVKKWRQEPPPWSGRKFYAAYPREQLLGSAQRIELLALGQGGAATVRGELRTPEGESVLKLPERTLKSEEITRVDWAVDTAALGKYPALVPVLEIREGESSILHRLPAFVLRSGWIENQNTVKAPLARMGDATAPLKVSLDDGVLRASVTWSGKEPLRSVDLYRNDRRMAAFTENERPRVQVVLRGAQEPGWIHAEIRNGKLLSARRSDNNTEEYVRWDEGRFSAALGRGILAGLELEASPDTTLVLSSRNAEDRTISLAELLAGGPWTPLGSHPAEIGIADFEALADNRTDLPQGATALSLRWLVAHPRPTDSYHARLETASGRIIETPWIYPGLQADKTERIFVIRSPFSLGIRKPEDFLTALPAGTKAEVVVAEASPAVLQETEWRFDSPRRPGLDTAGHFSLIPGGGGMYNRVEPARVPAWLEAGGPDGSGCLAFDGTDDRAQLPVQQEPKGPFHISFAIRPEAGSEREGAILSAVPPANSGDSGHSIFITRLADGHLRAGRRNLVEVTSPNPLPPEAWSRVDVLFSGDRIVLKIDGKNVGEATCDPNFARFGNSRLYVGGPEQPFRGRLDDLKIRGFLRKAEMPN